MTFPVLSGNLQAALQPLGSQALRLHPLVNQALHVPVPVSAPARRAPALTGLGLLPGADPDRLVVQACVLALLVLPFLL